MFKPGHLVRPAFISAHSLGVVVSVEGQQAHVQWLTSRGAARCSFPQSQHQTVDLINVSSAGVTPPEGSRDPEKIAW